MSEFCGPAAAPKLYDLDDKPFVPFDLNDSDYDYSPLFDVHPDENFFNEVYKYGVSEYLHEDSFKDKCSQYSITDSKCFSLIHVNSRSLPKNMESMVQYIEQLELRFNVIAVTETWLRESNYDLFNIDGYYQESNFRTKRTGGGVSLFIRKHLNSKYRVDVSVFTDCIESLFIEIDKEHLNQKKNVIVGVVYRPPNNDVDSFNVHITNILTKLKGEMKIVYLLSDFNIDLLNADKHESSSEFLETMYSFGFLPNSCHEMLSHTDR